MNNDDIRPCPFCGAVPYGVEGYAIGKTAYYYVTCRNTDCEVQPTADLGFTSPESAVRAWNKRVE